ncbi:MAG: hypothetical protein JWO93_205 [Micrococcaceae bacterium]|nr:hypothetical protein [Micrococcaceae bacterium]
MELRLWFLLPAGLLVLVAAAWLVLRRHRRNDGTAAPVAHADRLTSLPSYQAALRRYRRWLGVVLASGLVLALCLLVLASRPVLQGTGRDQRVNRDIVLCLDVSGSMTSTDALLVEVFRSLAEQFRGERIGLTIFDSSAVQVFPLTDDYDFVTDQLDQAKAALDGDSGGYSFFDGTYNGRGSSLIGDGLASCVSSFPRLGTEERPRSIILATDNKLAGRPIFELPEAADLAARNSIRVYGINPNDFDAGTPRGQPGEEMRAAMRETGGDYFALNSRNAVTGIVARVQATEAAKLPGPERTQFSDRPELLLWVALAALACMVLGLRRIRS